MKTGRRNIVARKKILREDLAAFQLSRGLNRAEDCAARLAELIDDPVDKRNFRTHDGKVDAIIGGYLYIVGSANTGRRFCHAGIARRRINLLYGWTLGEPPDKGVFAAAGSDNKYVQRKSSSS